MLTVYPANETTGLTLVTGEIENDFELAIAREAVGQNDMQLHPENGLFYLYTPIEIGTYLTWMVKS